MKKFSLLTAYLVFLDIYNAVAYEYLRSGYAKDDEYTCDKCLFCCPAYYDCAESGTGGLSCCPYGYTLCPQYNSCCTSTTCGPPSDPSQKDYCFSTWTWPVMNPTPAVQIQ